MVAVGVAYPGALAPAEIAARSRSELDRPLSFDAELTVASFDGEARLLGAFQRGSAHGGAQHRRGSGGATVRVGKGTLWVSLALARLDALVPCTPDVIVNRYARPLLRALTRVGALAHYFGRDWISVAHRPAAAIGFAHDRTSGRTAVEAFVAVSTPFAEPGRASFLGKIPGTLVELGSASIAMDRVAQAVIDAYAPRASPMTLGPWTPDADERHDPPWAATVPEAIGDVGAGPDARGRMRVGGELMVSRDALAELEACLARGEDVLDAVTRSLGAPGVALEGVRSLGSIAAAIAAAQNRA